MPRSSHPTRTPTGSRTTRRSVRLRPAQADDIPALAQLEKACFRTPVETFHPRQIRRLITQSKGLTLVATCDQHLAGWAVGLLRQHRQSVSGRLYAVAVHPDDRGTGLGERLTQAILTGLTQRGAQRIYLEVRATNRAAITLYEKLGFTPRHLLPNYYAPGEHGVSMVLVFEIKPRMNTDKHR